MKRDRHGFLLFLAAVAVVCTVTTPASVAAQTGAPAADPVLEAAPINPAFLHYLAEKSNLAVRRTTAEGYPLGYLPPPLKLPPTDTATALRSTRGLPAVYDLRNVGGSVYVTAVRNQQQCGSCWAFGAMASLESFLKYKRAVTADLSEADLNENHGFDFGVCMGGNWFMSTAYMARWSGPVSESDVPYPYYQTEVGGTALGGETEGVAAIGDDRPLAKAAPGVADVYHVQNVYLMSTAGHPLTSEERSALKQAIYDNGAVNVAFY